MSGIDSQKQAADIPTFDFGIDRYKGYIENVKGPQVWGWAVDGVSAAPLKLDLWVGPCNLGKVSMRTFRPDILFGHGRAMAGFDFHFFDGETPGLQGLGFSFFEGLPFQLLFPDGTIIPGLGGAEPFIGGAKKDEKGRIAQIEQCLEQGDVFSLKHGLLIEPFRKHGELINQRIESLSRFFSAFETFIGEPISLGYGSLLGAVRDGTVIPHDNDFDAFVFTHVSTLADVIVWQIQLTKRMRNAGFACGISPNCPTTIIVEFEGHCLDVFIAWIRPEGFLTSYHLDAPIAEGVLFPLAKIKFGPSTFPVPANSDYLLSCIYGTNWSKPDPNFMWEPPVRSIEVEKIWKDKLNATLDILAPSLKLNSIF